MMKKKIKISFDLIQSKRIYDSGIFTELRFIFDFYGDAVQFYTSIKDYIDLEKVVVDLNIIDIDVLPIRKIIPKEHKIRHYVREKYKNLSFKPKIHIWKTEKTYKPDIIIKELDKLPEEVRKNLDDIFELEENLCPKVNTEILNLLKPYFRFLK